MDSTLKLRLLTKSDAPQYLELRLEGVRECPEAFLEDVSEVKRLTLEDAEKRVKSSDTFPESFLLGVFADLKLVGMANGFRREIKKIGHKAFIGQIYVSPNFRRRGISKTLMEESIRRIRQFPEVEQIQLWVSTESESARTLYDALGFVVTSIEREYFKLDHRYVDCEQRVLRIKKAGSVPDPA